MVIKTNVIAIIIDVIDWLVSVLFYLREGLQPTPATPIQYQGGEPIFPTLEAMKVQPIFIPEVGDRGAIFLEWVHQWTQYNRREGKNPYDGTTWTYNSYPDLEKNYFHFWGKGWCKNNIPKLENAGYLISTQDAPFCKKGQKAYRINYEKCLWLLGSQKSVDPLPKSSRPPTSNTSEGYAKKVDNNIVKQEKESKKTKQEKQTTPTAARAREVDPLPIGGGDVVEKQDHDSGVFAGMGEFVIDQKADCEDTGVMAAMESAPPDCAESPPDNAKLIAQLREDLKGSTELTDVKAEIMIERYGAKRCRAVADWTLDTIQVKTIDNPVGWWISELTKQTVGIDEKYVRKTGADPDPYTSGEWAHIVKS